MVGSGSTRVRVECILLQRSITSHPKKTPSLQTFQTNQYQQPALRLFYFNLLHKFLKKTVPQRDSEICKVSDNEPYTITIGMMRVIEL
ncbi:unnamed protein product [Orchesella dallaii]|uniref:Uncharacterized protein n=1 Tax=Orchesella dallaii TaxID=48710 RepID=A0ABP1QRF9_9HEXA